MSLMQQTWSNVVFIHQEVDVNSLAKLIPSPLELDLHQGKAYISFVGFLMKDIKPLGLFAAPYFDSMKEFNLRTYIKYKNQTAVYFFSLDATKSLLIEIARKFFMLNYLKASIHYDFQKRIECIRSDNRDHLVKFNADFEIENEIEKDELTNWLTERYSYLESRKQIVYQGKLEHPKWLLKKVSLKSIEENYLTTYGIKPINNEYICHYSSEIKVEIKSFKAIN
jgi:uncharacterized protein YqjF (DUF2071 family)